VRVKNICGFADSEKFNFIENTCETTFYLPTAFSPNGDGLNDNLEIFGRNFTKLNLKIFNRWGELIFIARNQSEQWNGTLNGSPIPEGVYAWVADYESTVNKYKGQKFQKRGSLTVVR
jgi:gliding motility-associated-like protein